MQIYTNKKLRQIWQISILFLQILTLYCVGFAQSPPIGKPATTPTPKNANTKPDGKKVEKTQGKPTNTVMKEDDPKSLMKYLKRSGSFDSDEDMMTIDETNLQYLVTASFFANDGDYSNAIKTLSEAIKRDPKFSSGYLNRGYYYFVTGQTNLAIEDFTQIINLGKGSPEVYHNRGLFYLQNGDYKRAIKDLSQAINLAPKYISAYRLRAIAYRKSNKILEAEADEKKGKELDAVKKND